MTPQDNRLLATVPVADAPFTHAAAAATRLGLDRDRNKDAWWAPESTVPPERLAAKGHLYVVCDGSGGQVTGGLSQSVVALIAGHYYEDPDVNVAASLARAMSTANAEIFHRDSPALQSGVGLTVVAGVFRGQEWVVGSLGDGRVFLLRDGTLRCLTVDYSWLEQAESTPPAGAGGQEGLTPNIKSDAWPDIPTDLWPDILSGLQPGGLGNLQPDDQPSHRLDAKPSLRLDDQPSHRLDDKSSPGPDLQRGVQPEVKSILAQPGDRLLLCTYGVWGVVPEDQVRRTLMWPTPEQATAMLMDRVAMLSGQEDATALVLTLQAEKRPPPPRRPTPLWVLALLPVVGAVAASLLLLQMWGGYPPEPAPLDALAPATVVAAAPAPTETLAPTPSRPPEVAADVTPTRVSLPPAPAATSTPAPAITATVATPTEAGMPTAAPTVATPPGRTAAAPALHALPITATLPASTGAVSPTVDVTVTTPGAIQPVWTATVTATAVAEDLYCVVPAAGQTIYAWLDCARRGPAMALGKTFPIDRRSVTVRMCTTTFVPIQLKGQKYFLATARIGRLAGSQCRRVPARTFDRPR